MPVLLAVLLILRLLLFPDCPRHEFHSLAVGAYLKHHGVGLAVLVGDLFGRECLSGFQFIDFSHRELGLAHGVLDIHRFLRYGHDFVGIAVDADE